MLELFTLLFFLPFYFFFYSFFSKSTYLFTSYLFTSYLFTRLACFGYGFFLYNHFFFNIGLLRDFYLFSLQWNLYFCFRFYWTFRCYTSIFSILRWSFLYSNFFMCYRYFNCFRFRHWFLCYSCFFCRFSFGYIDSFFNPRNPSISFFWNICRIFLPNVCISVG